MPYTGIMKDQRAEIVELGRKRAAIAVKITIACVAIFGVIVELIRPRSLSGALNMFSYFTIQSNLIVAGVCLASALRRAGESPLLSAVRGGATIWITVTFIVFHLFLSKTYHPVGIFALACTILHYVVPNAMILEWLLLEPKGRMKLRYNLYWLGYPLLYVLFSEARGWSRIDVGSPRRRIGAPRFLRSPRSGHGSPGQGDGEKAGLKLSLILRKQVFP
jgi:hypothetical protein